MPSRTGFEDEVIAAIGRYEACTRNSWSEFASLIKRLDRIVAAMKHESSSAKDQSY
jgi:hypothetical protein